MPDPDDTPTGDDGPSGPVHDDPRSAAGDDTRSAATADTESDDGAHPTAAADAETDGELPADLPEEARRLTRLARRATDDREADAYRRDRDERLAAHGFTARLREEDDTLVCYPDEWIENGEVRLDRVSDTSRAYELSVSGPGDPDDWDAVAEHNRDLAARVREEHGSPHGANARSFAEFMSNHYARRMETASREELVEFRDDYYPRNAWHDDETREAVERSLAAVFETADRPFPL